MLSEDGGAGRHPRFFARDSVSPGVIAARDATVQYCPFLGTAIFARVKVTTAMQRLERVRMSNQPTCLPVTLLIALLGSASLAHPRGGAEFQVNSYSTGGQTRPAVATDSRGGFVVVWGSEGQDGSGLGIFGQRYDGSGARVAEEFRVNSYTRLNQSGTAVATAPDGRTVVVWGSSKQDGDNWGVHGQRYDARGARAGAEFQINTYTTGPQGPADVAMTKDGGFVVVWRGGSRPDPQDGQGFGAFGQRFDSTGKRLGGEFQVNTYTTRGQTEVSVDADAKGGFVVVWTSYHDRGPGSYGGTGTFGQRFDSTGKRLGGEFQVNTYTTNPQRFPSVAVRDDGGFAVVWASVDQDGVGFGVFGQRFDSAGSRIGSEFQVNTHTMGLQGYPDVATDGAGRFVVTWSSLDQDGSAFGVFGQRYDSAGSRVGGEFQVNTHTPRNQAGVAVDVYPGGFVVVWQSSRQDGSRAGIFGRRYEWTDKSQAAK
jgi:hypothetical protein